MSRISLLDNDIDIAIGIVALILVVGKINVGAVEESGALLCSGPHWVVSEVEAEDMDKKMNTVGKVLLLESIPESKDRVHKFETTDYVLDKDTMGGKFEESKNFAMGENDGLGAALDTKLGVESELPDLLPLDGDVRGQTALDLGGKTIKHNQLVAVQREPHPPEEADLRGMAVVDGREGHGDTSLDMDEEDEADGGEPLLPVSEADLVTALGDGLPHEDVDTVPDGPAENPFRPLALLGQLAKVVEGLLSDDDLDVWCPSGLPVQLERAGEAADGAANPPVERRWVDEEGERCDAAPRAAVVVVEGGQEVREVDLWRTNGDRGENR